MFESRKRHHFFSFPILPRLRSVDPRRSCGRPLALRTCGPAAWSVASAQAILAKAAGAHLRLRTCGPGDCSPSPPLGRSSLTLRAAFGLADLWSGSLVSLASAQVILADAAEARITGRRRPGADACGAFARKCPEGRIRQWAWRCNRPCPSPGIAPALPRRHGRSPL